jgi:2-keto-3-deoxy-galactonokinase
MKNTSEVHDLLASNRAHKRANIAQLDTIESKMFYGGTHRESERKNTNSNEVFDVRIQELANTLAKVFAAIKNDELLSTMMDDPTSKKFAEHRVREIIEECISNDRENLLKDLYQQNATLETENYDLEQEYAKVYF